MPGIGCRVPVRTNSEYSYKKPDGRGQKPEVRSDSFILAFPRHLAPDTRHLPSRLQYQGLHGAFLNVRIAEVHRKTPGFEPMRDLI